jgi:hypothetical protein
MLGRRSPLMAPETPSNRQELHGVILPTRLLLLVKSRGYAPGAVRHALRDTKTSNGAAPLRGAVH